MKSDAQLLNDYVRENSQAAFAEIARRYINLVYAAAYRQLRDQHLAEDITQSVFLILSEKAASIKKSTILPAWLHRTTRYASANANRLRAIRSRHEQEAVFMRSSATSDPSQTQSDLAQLLDEAVNRLGERDRQMILSRYFLEDSMDDIARKLNISTDAAKRRSTRAVQRLRQFFLRRGFDYSAPAFIAALTQQSSVTASPQLLGTVQQMAASSVSAIAMARSTIKLLRFARLKFATAFAASVLVGVVGSAVVVDRTTSKSTAALAQTTEPSAVAPELTPVQTLQRFFDARDIGDVETMESCMYFRTAEEEQFHRAALDVWGSTARFCKAFEDAFGQGELQKLQFKGLPSHIRIASTSLRIDGDRASVIPVMGSYAMPMIRINEVWKIDAGPCWKLDHASLAKAGFKPLSMAMAELTPSMILMRRALDQLTKDIEGGAYATPEDAYNVLDASMHGLASVIQPSAAAAVVKATPFAPPPLAKIVPKP